MRLGTPLILVTAFGIAAAMGSDFAAGSTAYEKGDYATALKEWGPLAKAGGSAAQFNLGLLYYDGRGVPQNFSEAAQWFEKSADHGYVKAQHNLGAMFAVGKGVKRDPVQAYKWLSLCAAGGEQSCLEQRDLVAAKLSSAKLATAQRLAREWKPVASPQP
jgi:TPR repeat protein